MTAAWLNRRKRRLQILDRVINFLDADGKPHERIGDPERRPHLRRDRSVGHDGGMVDEAFDAAKAFGERKKMGVLEEPPSTGKICFQYNCDHATKRAHLFLRELVLRMPLQSRIINFFYL